MTARRLDQGATTALAYQSREKTAVSKCVKFYGLFIYNFKEYCEAQGKGRSKGQLRMVTQRSFIDYRLSIIDILSLSYRLNIGQFTGALQAYCKRPLTKI